LHCSVAKDNSLVVNIPKANLVLGKAIYEDTKCNQNPDCRVCLKRGGVYDLDTASEAVGILSDLGIGQCYGDLEQHKCMLVDDKLDCICQCKSKIGVHKYKSGWHRVAKLKRGQAFFNIWETSAQVQALSSLHDGKDLEISFKIDRNPQGIVYKGVNVKDAFNPSLSTAFQTDAEVLVRKLAAESPTAWQTLSRVTLVHEPQMPDWSIASFPPNFPGAANAKMSPEEDGIVIKGQAGEACCQIPGAASQAEEMALEVEVFACRAGCRGPLPAAR
jgi:hypothetical protein